MPAKSFFFTKIMVGDVGAAERFYTRALGLEVMNHVKRDGDKPVEETILVVPGNDAGSRFIVERSFDRNPPPTGETILGFFVDDVEQSVASALKAGGRLIHPVQDNPEHKIRLAFVADPEGHVIELLGPLG